MATQFVGKGEETLPFEVTIFLPDLVKFSW
jgi:hypothetical protein